MGESYREREGEIGGKKERVRERERRRDVVIILNPFSIKLPGIILD